MAKTALEKQLERNRKSEEKRARDQKRLAEKQAREEKRGTISTNIINSFQTVAGFTILNAEAEELLEAIIRQFKTTGNQDNLYVNFDETKLSEPMRAAAYQYFDVLHQLGLITKYLDFGDTAGIYLSYSGRNYFGNKQIAIEKDKAERERRSKLETDLLKIHGMNNQQLQKIYIEAVEANFTLKESLEIQNKQLDKLHDLFVSQEDGVSISKETKALIEQLLTDAGKKDHRIKDFLADKGMDAAISMVSIILPGILKAAGINV